MPALLPQTFFLHMFLPKHKKTLSYFLILKKLVKKTSFFLWSLVDYIGGLLLYEKFLDAYCNAFIFKK